MTKAALRAGRAALLVCCMMLTACGSSEDDAWLRGGYTVAIVALDGSSRVVGALPVSVFAPRVSPDGRQLAFEMRDTPSGEGVATERIWVAPLEQLRKRQPLPLVGEARNWAPMWTHDGQRLVFVVTGAGRNTLYWRRADGSDEAERLIDGLSAEGTTPDGRTLSFITLGEGSDYGISLLDMPSRVPELLTDLPRSEQHSSHISPDGRWIAYGSNETGSHEVWAEPLPPTGDRYRVTEGGGSHPVWATDGASLFFNRGGTLHRAAFEVTKETEGQPQVVKIGAAQALPISGFQQGYRRRQYDILPDGKHFLMLYPPGVLR